MLATACSGSSAQDASPRDAGAFPDAFSRDAEIAVDGGIADAAALADAVVFADAAGFADAVVFADATGFADAMTSPDATVFADAETFPDAAIDAGLDAGSLDAGSLDALAPGCEAITPPTHLVEDFCRTPDGGVDTSAFCMTEIPSLVPF